MSITELGAWLTLVLAGLALYVISNRVTNHHLRLLIRLAAFALAESGINQASYASYFGPVGSTPGVFWLTSGISIAVLLLADRKTYIYYVLVSIAVHLHSGMILHDMQWTASLSLTTANIVEEVAGSILLRWAVGGPPDITRPKTFVLYCLLCAGVAAMLGAVVGATALWICYDQHNWFRNWQVWWFSDAMGMLSIGLAILTWNAPKVKPLQGSRKWEKTETIIVVSTLIATALISVGPLSLSFESFLDYPYLVLPLLVWSALRLDARIATTAAVFVAIIAVYTASSMFAQLPFIPDNALGPFRVRGRSIAQTVLAIQAFLFVTLLTTQILVSITHERIRSESQRQQLRMQLYESQRMESVAQLASGVAHDLNNLLAIIKLYRDQVEEIVGKNEQLRTALEAMDYATDNATALSRSMLDLSRQEPAEFSQFDADKLLKQSMKLCAPLLPQTISVRVLPTPPGDYSVVGNPKQLQQAILNLVLNARDAMTPGGGDLSIWVMPDPKSDRYIEIGVSDTGTGIKPEDLKHVLQPLFTTKAKGLGTGLGLSIVQSIAEQHSGNVVIESDLGKGTTVRLKLACHPTTNAAVPRLQGGTLASGMAVDQQTNQAETGSVLERRALIFIADPQVRGAVISELIGHGWSAIGCDSFEVFIEQLEQSRQLDRTVTRGVIDLRACTAPEHVIERALPVPVIVLCENSSSVNLMDSQSYLLELPIRVKDLIKAIDNLEAN